MTCYCITSYYIILYHTIFYHTFMDEQTYPKRFLPEPFEAY